ncbi:MAG: dapL [Chlamydiales bacterium]|jgi:LL-diaminopimelate aminotransferase|nr:dapL [Chlamydiales bacterium]
MLNSHYLSLQENYLFPLIAQKVKEFSRKLPETDILKLGIGDVSLPLPKVVVNACIEAVTAMGTSEGFKGYGPEQGYPFLREAIVKNEYANLGITADDIFISDGTKCDIANIQELFGIEATIGITDPTYPVYTDSNVMAGRGGNFDPVRGYEKFVYFSCKEETGFLPELPKQHCDLIYICSPNNPTGIAMSKQELQQWVEYAERENALILYDGAYAPFIQSKDVVKSIYEVPGACKVAIEFRSFSKSAGFTGLRCAYCVVPQSIQVVCKSNKVSLNALWKRRQTTKFNGVAYPIQYAAAATYTPAGKNEIQLLIDYYMRNAAKLKMALQELGYTCYGGEDCPFIWWKVPINISSWQFFDILLEKLQIVTTPGSGFGPCGEGFIRLSAFSKEDALDKAITRLKKLPEILANQYS